jgi:fido (protein-threonine AMPylation protein)
MATPHEKLAASLAELEKLQQGGRRVFRSRQLGRVHRERLVQHGFLRPIVKGWLVACSPGDDPGDTTPWYASFWGFCACYANERFGDGWHLSPEQSLLLNAENTVVPRQVILYSPKGTNNSLELLFGTSLYDLKASEWPKPTELLVRDQLRVLTSAAALVRVSEAFFTRNPVEAQVALLGIGGASELLPQLLDGGHSVVAGRLAGAFRRVGRPETADEIGSAMNRAGYDVRETDPFAAEQTIGLLESCLAPIVGRIRALWMSMRPTVIEALPSPPGLPERSAAYLRFVDEIYPSDAYHSLSIEGYQVTPELIERVREGAWSPDDDTTDRRSRDALVARGYWQAFGRVKQTVASILREANAGKLVRTAHREWYRELFAPCVAAGMIPAAVLAGFRNGPVYIRGSRHVPPRAEVVVDAMNTTFELLEQEPEASVRAVLGHWLFGYVHPYPDGNGRIARFVMNAMLASGGYPWTVIPVDERARYMAALERASVHADIEPFAAFVAECVRRSMAHPESGPTGQPDPE